MGADLNATLRLEVPIIVQVGVRTMRMQEILNLVPGMIIELPKGSDEELELLVNNKVIASGLAVKVGENYGLRVTQIGKVPERIRALGNLEQDPHKTTDDMQGAFEGPKTAGKAASADAEPNQQRSERGAA